MKITIVQSVHYPQGWVNEKTSFEMPDAEVLNILEKSNEIVLRKQNRYEDMGEVINAMMCEKALREGNYIGNLEDEVEETK